MPCATPFADVIEAAEQLDVAEQEEILALLTRRLAE